MKINKDELKESLSIEDVFSYVSELGGEPKMQQHGESFVSRTICHNPPHTGSYKLYYYDNTHLFKCYTECEDIGGFDIYELTLKTKRIAGIEWTLSTAIDYIASYFGYSQQTFEIQDNEEVIKEYEIIENYEKFNNFGSKQQVELTTYNKDALRQLPHPRIRIWEQEGITREVIKQHRICYDPVNQGIVIPHYDMNNNLVGIRERTLLTEDEQNYGKYRPAVLNGIMYNHPLSFNLYNLNNSKDNIRIMRKAIVFEGEKSPMQFASYFGKDHDISVACCGSALSSYQVKLLLNLGVNEIVVAFDKQFQHIGDNEFKRWTKKLIDINNKYAAYANISFLFDKFNLLGYKDSPTDKGKEVFLELFEKRITI